MVTTTCFPPTAAATRRYPSFRTPYLPSYMERKSAEHLRREPGCSGMADREGGGGGEDTASQRKRIAVACGRCRKRKIRCSGDAGNGEPCVNCKNAGSEPCQFLRVSSQEVAQVKPSAFTYDVNASRNVQARASSAASPICLPMTGLHDGLSLGDTSTPSGRRAVEGPRGGGVPPTSSSSSTTSITTTTGVETEGGGGGGGSSPTTSAYGNKQYYAATGWVNGGGASVYGDDVSVDYTMCSPPFTAVADEASPYRLTSTTRANGLMYMDAETTYAYGGTLRPPTAAETSCLPYHHQGLGGIARPERLPGRAGPTTAYRTADYRRSAETPSGLNGGYHGYASATHLAFGGAETAAGYALSDPAFGAPGAMTAPATTTATATATATDGDHHGQSLFFRPHESCATLATDTIKGSGDEGKPSSRMRS
ncbi:hypothetical protein L249_1139 [Ophiocordyceps polyrhachis-furcata BCC 54312]|uniref:Zn(2)-C6 fungal-type domain-containing protein n=1 Tax=Ophiocordyceps polyrhachis-furcata BCC 54312 TaxID=1330021 RepID=A0A367LFF0_9HYPO|nr:hypothetical protein L249_1139 [Ophiocordyceps polyrhachis-furcata BCC 54312]